MGGEEGVGIEVVEKKVGGGELEILYPWGTRFTPRDQVKLSESLNACWASR